MFPENMLLMYYFLCSNNIEAYKYKCIVFAIFILKVLMVSCSIAVFNDCLRDAQDACMIMMQIKKDTTSVEYRIPNFKLKQPLKYGRFKILNFSETSYTNSMNICF